MAAELKAGGCERCGREDHLTYAHWQFLCAECRDVLALEAKRDHEHALMLDHALYAGGPVTLPAR